MRQWRNGRRSNAEAGLQPLRAHESSGGKLLRASEANASRDNPPTVRVQLPAAAQRGQKREKGR